MKSAFLKENFSQYLCFTLTIGSNDLIVEQGIKTILGNTWKNTQVFSVLKKYRARQERIQNVRLREHPIEISKFELQWIKDI